MEMDSFSEGEYDSDASGMDDNAEDDVPNEQDNELNNEETEDDGKGESKSNSKSTLMSNISKLSKYKSNMHRKDVRKIKSKEKRDRRERAKVRGCGHFLLVNNVVIHNLSVGIGSAKANSSNN